MHSCCILLQVLLSTGLCVQQCQRHNVSVSWVCSSRQLGLSCCWHNYIQVAEGLQVMSGAKHVSLFICIANTSDGNGLCCRHPSSSASVACHTAASASRYPGSLSPQLKVCLNEQHAPAAMLVHFQSVDNAFALKLQKHLQ